MERMRDSASLRRNLKPGQRAAIVLEFTELVESLREQARERFGQRTDLLPELEKGSSPKHVHVELSEKAGIGKSSMSYLMAVQKEEPELKPAAIKRGYDGRRDRRMVVTWL